MRRRSRNALGRARGYAGCARCGDTFDWKESHVTQYESDSWPQEGCFPLCELCWRSLTPEGRWPYYDELVNKWQDTDDASDRADLYRVALKQGPYYEQKRERIREAVMAGK